MIEVSHTHVMKVMPDDESTRMIHVQLHGIGTTEIKAWNCQTGTQLTLRVQETPEGFVVVEHHSAKDFHTLETKVHHIHYADLPEEDK